MGFQFRAERTRSPLPKIELEVPRKALSRGHIIVSCPSQSALVQETRSLSCPGFLDISRDRVASAFRLHNANQSNNYRIRAVNGKVNAGNPEGIPRITMFRTFHADEVSSNRVGHSTDKENFAFSNINANTTTSTTIAHRLRKIAGPVRSRILKP